MKLPPFNTVFFLVLILVFQVAWWTVVDAKGNEKTCTKILENLNICDPKTCPEWCDFLYDGDGICTNFDGRFVCLCTYPC
ncbi:hypothetical protein MRB53_005205 [Persea americana]|uniref:Uncharacterized protein n=1 Tax=Persea americana TaxID=3435 RepID=A0ACC2ME61_PERAE|nr:hypothetical protein MRB53_005205 [Persea americana]